MKKPWRYHGECYASGGPAAKTLGACSPSGFALGTSLGTTFTMIPPRLFQIISQITLVKVVKKSTNTLTVNISIKAKDVNVEATVGFLMK